MNLILLSWRYITDRKLNTFLNVLLFGFGIAIIVVLLLFSVQMEKSITRNAKGINLVVAAKGSPLQIILSSIYHVDFPTGNIKLQEAYDLSRNSLIKNSIPLALGDSYKGYRIVGTTHSYLQLYQAEMAAGKPWGTHHQVTLGAGTAGKLKLREGDEIITEHGMQEGGMAHEDHKLTVSGVLKPTGTVLDNLIFTSVESVWEAHGSHESESESESESEGEEHPEHDHGHSHAADTAEILGISLNPAHLADKEITALIIQYAGPMAAVRLPRMVNSTTNMQAASPAFETARLFTLFGAGVEVVNGFAYLIIFIAALSIFIALYNSLKERVYDLAIMRTAGASARFLFLHVVMESIIIAFLGSIFGLLLAHTAVFVIDTFLMDEGSQLGISAFYFVKEEIYVVAAGFLVAMVASVIPAVKAARTDISETLAKG